MLFRECFLEQFSGYQHLPLPAFPDLDEDIAGLQLSLVQISWDGWDPWRVFMFSGFQTLARNSQRYSCPGIWKQLSFYLGDVCGGIACGGRTSSPPVDKMAVQSFEHFVVRHSTSGLWWILPPNPADLVDFICRAKQWELSLCVRLKASEIIFCGLTAWGPAEAIDICCLRTRLWFHFLCVSVMRNLIHSGLERSWTGGIAVNKAFQRIQVAELSLHEGF